MRVSNKSNFKNACLVHGGPKGTSKAREFILDEYKKISMKTNTNIRNSGSAALDLAYVAAGRFDGYFQENLNLWDIAAGIILVKEAGGILNNIDLSKKENLDIKATSSSISEKILKKTQ